MNNLRGSLLHFNTFQTLWLCFLSFFPAQRNLCPYFSLNLVPFWEILLLFIPSLWHLQILPLHRFPTQPVCFSFSLKENLCMILMSILATILLTLLTLFLNKKLKGKLATCLYTLKYLLPISKVMCSTFLLDLCLHPWLFFFLSSEC